MSLTSVPQSALQINEVVPLAKQGNGCDYHRIVTPFQQLGYNKKLEPDSTMEEVFDGARVVTFNRDPGLKIEDLNYYRKSLGFKVVIDIDDYWVLHENHALYHIWKENGYTETLEKLIREADAVTCTTYRLADKVLGLNSNVYCIPNAVPFGEFGSQWESKGNKKYGGEPYKILTKKGSKIVQPRTRFGWVGGSSHLNDIASIAEVFKEFPFLDFSLCGFNNVSSQKRNVNVWNYMENIVSLNRKNPNYKRVLTKPLQEYMHHYDNLDCQVVPLENIQWNGYKSSLKCYEAGLKKVACIVSKSSPYIDDVPADVVTYCETVDEWLDAIDDHQDLGYVKQQAGKLHEWVRAHRNLYFVSAYRFKVYEHILSGQPAFMFPSFDQVLDKQFERDRIKLAA